MQIKLNRRNFFKYTLLAVGLIVISNFIYGLYKPLPAMVNYSSPVRSVDDSSVHFLSDSTFLEADDSYQSSQQIFDAVFTLIDNAEKFVLVDMFLLNDYQGSGNQAYRALSTELVGHLVNKKNQNPTIDINVITDPINTAYGGSVNKNIEILKTNGINVIETNLPVLRDSNPVYSAFWRSGGRWLGGFTGKWLPHPLSSAESGVTLQTYLDLANFKANHRKVIVADSQGKIKALISSANPHDGSSRHSNIALSVEGKLAEDIYNSEIAVASFSGVEISSRPDELKKPSLDSFPNNKGGVDIQLITEGKIREAILNEIDNTQPGDKIMLAMFYISDRSIIKALKLAYQRGVSLKLIFDPNKDAFGYKKNGIPNRSVAFELVRSGLPGDSIRWYDTHGEQFHTKMILIDTKEGTSSLILGSANFTRRNVGNYNLETDVLVHSRATSTPINDARAYFEKIWNNTDNRQYTVPYSSYKDHSPYKYFLYRLQEFSGLSSF